MVNEVKNIVVGRIWDGPNENIKSGYIDFGILGRVQLEMVRSDRTKIKENSDWCMRIRIDRTMFGALGFVQKQIENVLFEDETDGTCKS